MDTFYEAWMEKGIEFMSALQDKADVDTQKLLSFSGECLQLVSRVHFYIL